MNKGDHVHYSKAYQVGLVEYVTENVYQVLSNIYPEGQGSTKATSPHWMRGIQVQGAHQEATQVSCQKLVQRWELLTESTTFVLAQVIPDEDPTNTDLTYSAYVNILSGIAKTQTFEAELFFHDPS